MKPDRFNEVVERRLAHCADLLLAKKGEYGVDDDRLIHFKRAAMMRNTTPLQALLGMKIKHTVSIEMIIEMMDADPTYVPSLKMIRAKFTDEINYFLLAEGLIEERRDMLHQIDMARAEETVLDNVAPEGFISIIEQGLQAKSIGQQMDPKAVELDLSQGEFKVCPVCMYNAGFHAPNCPKLHEEKFPNEEDKSA